jgi:DNA ligase-associated putative exonuclease
MSGLLRVGAGGIACPAGGFEIDPRRPAPLALLTHAHADHARPGSGRYLAAEPSLPLLRRRLGANATLLGVPYGETLRVGGVRVSFHPAGHILGSAQIRVEAAGEVWVATGDFKRQPDPTCAPFEPVPCDVLVTESTFARPAWRWPDPGTVAEGILAWWEEGRAAGRASVLLCYALGKAQRVLAELARLCQRRVFVHPAIDAFLPAYRCTLGDSALLPTRRLDSVARGATFAGELVLAPPSAIDGAESSGASPSPTTRTGRASCAASARAGPAACSPSTARRGSWCARCARTGSKPSRSSLRPARCAPRSRAASLAGARLRSPSARCAPRSRAACVPGRGPGGSGR